jgi:peptidoglycan-N-acetylglucosamine deacetylase
MIDMIHSHVVEVLSVEKADEQYYLKVRISLPDDVVLYWKIDDFTANHILSATDFSETYKYRLSFMNHLDTIKMEQVNCITKTNRENSMNIYFSSSDDFKENLHSLKMTPDLNGIENLSFLSRTLPISSNERVEEKVESVILEKVESEPIQPPLEENKTNVSAKRPSIFKWVSIVSIALIALMLIGYSSFKNVSSQDDLAKAAEIKENPNSTEKENSVSSNHRNIQEKPVENSNEDTVEVNEDERLDDTSKNEEKNKETDYLTIPFVELSNVENFYVPVGSVALTFDDGPSVYTDEIVDILKEYGVGGTFFFIGTNIKKYPEQVQYAYDQGYSIGSHSQNHVDVGALSYENQLYEINLSRELIEEITGVNPNLFRPPFGSYNQETLKVMEDHGLKAVLWNQDPKDWSGIGQKQILDYIKNSNPSGSIILLHESETVVKVLPSIIEHLQSQGLELVNLK